MKKFNIIVAINKYSGIGYKDKLSWKSLIDMKYFKKTTENHLFKEKYLIMGRKTW